MSLTINTNVTSLNAQSNLNKSNTALQTSIERLSSGLRVNSSKDDAAGLSIATRMDAQIKGQTVAVRNANDAVSFSQTTEGALSNVTDALQRMREIAVQAANATNGTGDRSNLDVEFQQLASEITRLGTDTNFNNIPVFGTATMVFQVGANSGQTITVAATTATSVTGNVLDVSSANSALSAIDTALESLNSARATLGATQNRFASVVSSLNTAITNETASKSRIVDTDFAAETANMTKSQILVQAGTSMLAQANSLPNSVLTLLKG